MGGRKNLIKSINNKFILFLAFHNSIKPEAISVEGSAMETLYGDSTERQREN